MRNLSWIAVLIVPVTLSSALPPPLTEADFHPVESQQVELGRLLFFDKVLSGNRNISCATCHHPLTDTGDGLALPVGEGGCGLGMLRDTGSGDQAIHGRVPRNAPPVFNLGARDVRVMFHDGRLEPDASAPSGFNSPAGDRLPPGIETVLAAQAMFPVTSPDEMAGQPGENAVADATAEGDVVRVWALLAERLRAIDAYADLFEEAFDDVESRDDITFVHAANAIGAFENAAWRATRTPFDRFLAGEAEALSPSADAGKELFYGKAGCADCHSGSLLTDQLYHAAAMPQIGPGKGDGVDGWEDHGRERVTADTEDRFCFRTPPLRNVALTGPWGHAGAYDTLEAMVRHQIDPVQSLENYDPQQAALPYREDLAEVDFVALADAEHMAALAASCELDPVALTDDEVRRLLDFLHALTDPASLDLRDDTPARVPSGLPLVECVRLPDVEQGDDDDDDDDDDDHDRFLPDEEDVQEGGPEQRRELERVW